MKKNILLKFLKILYFLIFIYGLFHLLINSTSSKSDVSINCATNNAVQKYRLTHVVVPFHFNQLESVMNSISKWSKYKPCLNIESRSIMPKIIFYIGYSTKNEININDIESKLRELIPHLECFSNGDQIDLVAFKMPSNSDNRIYGSTLMFENMLQKNHDLFKDLSYIFMMEADAKPIRSDWLNAIERDIGYNHFWIRGCAYFGDNPIDLARTRDLMYAYHWNGNAIYNMADAEFLDFYMNTLKPYVKSFTSFPFDYYFIMYILDETNWRKSRRILHKFLYTDVIINTYGLLKRQYTMDEFRKMYPNTYISHKYVPVDY